MFVDPDGHTTRRHALDRPAHPSPGQRRAGRQALHRDRNDGPQGRPADLRRRGSTRAPTSEPRDDLARPGPRTRASSTSSSSTTSDRKTYCVFADGATDGFLITPTKMPYAFGHPFLMLRNYEVPDDFYPMGELEQIEPLQLELNETRTQMLNHRKRYARKYLYMEDAFDDVGHQRPGVRRGQHDGPRQRRAGHQPGDHPDAVDRHPARLLQPVPDDRRRHGQGVRASRTTCVATCPTSAAPPPRRR